MTVPEIGSREAERLDLQARLDAAKTQEERNRLGQFATPSALATDVLRHASTLLDPREPMRFLDPAFGTGAFYSALLHTFPAGRIERADGYEIDPWYGERARDLWRDTRLCVHLEDFTRAQPPASDAARANLLICNPPYVRHHHLNAGEKLRLGHLAREASGVQLSGLAGLYCYFLCLAHQWMADGGIAGWLIPSEFMDVNYGHVIKSYLLHRVSLLHIHRFDPADVQFGDALVSSALVWFRKSAPSGDRTVLFSYGGTLDQPRVQRRIPARALDPRSKWTSIPLQDAQRQVPSHQATVTVGDLFTIRRGVATGGNDFFILTREQAANLTIPPHFLTPILPSPRALPCDEIEADDQGEPTIDPRLYLLTCSLSETEIRRDHPTLWAYLEQGKAEGIDRRYLCTHRTPWYAQERRQAAPLLCTYMGRQNGQGSPFRFILNHSRAIAANVYLMLYPKPMLHQALLRDPATLRSIWRALATIAPQRLIEEGRVYGGGLHKMEPNELARTPADPLLAVLGMRIPAASQQLSLW
jgi:adenine-specific DNA-methyltransferase